MLNTIKENLKKAIDEGYIPKDSSNPNNICIYRESIGWKSEPIDKIAKELLNKPDNYNTFLNVCENAKKERTNFGLDLLSKVINITSRNTEDNMYYLELPKGQLRNFFSTIIKDNEDCLMVAGIPHEDFEGYTYGLEFDDDYICIDNLINTDEVNNYLEDLIKQKTIDDIER